MAADLIQKIHANPSATADDVTNVDVPQDGFIESIFYDIRGVGMDALDDTVRVELSFASSSTFNNNDARISIFEVTVTQQFLTSGGGAQGKTGFLSQVNIPVSAGERIHIHYATGGAPGSCFINFYLYYSTSRAAPRRRSARRR